MTSVKSFMVLTAYHINQVCNQWFYRLQHIPILGRHVPNCLYGEMSFKRLILVFSILLTIGKRLLFNTLYYLFLIGCLGLMVKNKTISPTFLQHFLQGDALTLFQNVLVLGHLITFSCFQSVVLTESDSDLFTACRVFQIPAKPYLIWSEQRQALGKLLFMSLAIGLVLRIGGGTWWQGLAFVTLTMGSRLFWRAILLYLYPYLTKPDKVLAVVAISLSMLSLFTGMTYWVFLGPFNPAFFFSPMALWLGIGLWLVSLGLLWFNPHIERLVRNVIALKNAIKPTDLVAAVEIMAVEVDEAALQFSEKDRRLQGYGIAYLNALFVNRFSGIIGKRIRMTIALLTVATFLFNGLRYGFSDFAPISSQYFGKFLAISLYLGFLCYLGEYLMKLSFYHMDRPLLHYRFYRQKKTILSLLRTRFIWSLKLNFPIFLTLLSCFVATYALTFTWQWWEFSLLLICLLLGLCFFSLHYLYLYFIFQPFTEGMESKGFVYKTIYHLTWVFSYQLFQLESSNVVVTLLLFMLTYLVLGYFLVKYLAPKTFVLK